MNDVVDSAQKSEELFLKHSLSLRKGSLRPNGKCWNCSEVLNHHPKALFCDFECSIDYEKILRLKNG